LQLVYLISKHPKHGSDFVVLVAFLSLQCSQITGKWSPALWASYALPNPRINFMENLQEI
jgi:hypothetical protein